MKKLLILLFSLLISFNSYGGLFDKTVCVETDSQLRDGVIYLPNKTKPFSGKNLCKYQNGQNKSKGKIKDGKKNELWTEWEENGQIKLENLYEKGKLETKTKYKNGELERTTKYSYYNDVLNKMDDFIQSGEHYKEGNLIGKTKYVWYRHNGQLREEWNYKDGELYGRQRSWFANGQIEYEGASHYNGKLIGKATWWYKNGQIKEENNYKDDKEDGKWTAWYENGQKRQEGNYKNGKADGKWNWWNEEGDLIHTVLKK
jgi:uncharacterized protein